MVLFYERVASFPPEPVRTVSLWKATLRMRPPHKRCCVESVESYRESLKQIRSGKWNLELGRQVLLCTLKDTLSYDNADGTLTMNFTAGNQYAVTWNGWLTYQNNVIPLWSGVSKPITDPPVSVTKTYSPLSKVGIVGVLSTFTTLKNGITCSSWALVNTGTPGTAAYDDAVIEAETQ